MKFVLTLAVLMVAGLLVGGQFAKDQTAQAGSASQPTSPTVVPGSLSSDLQFVTVKSFRWTNDVILKADMTIGNSNAYVIKDVLIECDVYGKSGTVLRTVSARIYDVFPALKDKRVKGIQFGVAPDQSASASCVVKHFVRG